MNCDLVYRGKQYLKFSSSRGTGFHKNSAGTLLPPLPLRILRSSGDIGSSSSGTRHREAEAMERENPRNLDPRVIIKLRLRRQQKIGNRETWTEFAVMEVLSKHISERTTNKKLDVIMDDESQEKLDRGLRRPLADEANR